MSFPKHQQPESKVSGQPAAPPSGGERRSPSLEKQFASTLTGQLLAAEALALRALPRSKHRRLKREVCSRRFLLALKRQEFSRAEQILTSFSDYLSPNLEAINRYIAHVLNKGRAVQPQALLDSPALDPELRPLLQSALLLLENKPHDALALLDYPGSTFDIRFAAAMARRNIHRQMREHAAHAIDGMKFLEAEPDKILVSFAISVAGSAEAAGREDLFGRAIGRIISDRDRILKDDDLFLRFWRDAEIASRTIFDLDGALEILTKARVLQIKGVKDLMIDLLLMREEVSELKPVIAAAHVDLRQRAGLLPPPTETGEAAIILPAAAFRTNTVDYPGFRADIRFSMMAIARALRDNGVRHVVKGRIRTHGEVDLDVPFFSYHTISQHPLGLHIKETDRPSRFSFDNRGYAGWSGFSRKGVSELGLSHVDLATAEAFFRKEQASIIAGNVSKYTQAGLENEEVLPESYVFVGLQIIGDAVQELAHATPFAMVDEVMATCEKLGLQVVVKRHPLCNSPQVGRYLQQNVDAKRITLATGSIHRIISKAKAVCVVNSGVGAEALLHEKPVYVFGRSDYMAACFVCKSPGDFAAQFVPGKLPVAPEDLQRFWYVLRNEYAVDLRDRDKAGEWIARRVRQHLDETAARP
ncbi:MAG: hypothetical protein EOP88_18125 [Verrucomicrobiaceae bacterium]|nr:MAG: hypothetical protein EOP88_18125 [Verrucomicrobiaceae bacterium]